MKTKHITLVLLAFLGLSTTYAQVGIGTTNPHASAVLDVTADPANPKGFLPPRMTTGQRDAIPSPPEGLVIFNTTTNTIEFSNGVNWVSLKDNALTLVSASPAPSGVGKTGIGTQTPNANAILDVESTTQGFLPPRLSSTERTNINLPATGLVIYNTTIKCLEHYTGAAWVDYCGTDTDGDGIPDINDPQITDPCVPAQDPGYTGFDSNNSIWLAADCDGDGFTNEEELACGSDPYDATSTCPPSVVSLTDCTSPTVSATVIESVNADGTTLTIGYTGGNGQAYTAGTPIAATGVTGTLTATLVAGTLANGAGNLVLNLSGTPTSSGTASFAFTFGGQSCNIEVSVVSPCDGVTAPAGYGLVAAGGKCWLDRNLGATTVTQTSRGAYSSDADYVAAESSSFGDLYQWGRLADGHQEINRSVTPNVAVNNTTSTLSSGDVPGNNLFITTNNNNNNDWRQGGNDNLWQPATGTNNPCPTGFRVPTEAEWSAAAGGDGVSSIPWGNRDDAFNSPLRLPAAGGRNRTNGSLFNVGSDGYYWFSTVSGISARNLFFNSSNARMDAGNRAFGLSVRCLKD